MVCERLILLQIIILVEICSAGRQMKVTMKSVKCDIPDADVYDGSFTTCTLKPTRDGFGLTSVVYNFQKPANDIKLQIRAFFKYGTIFRPWISDLTNDVCFAVKNIESVPLLGKLIYKAMNEQVPGFVHYCPYIGEEGFYNVTVDKVFNSIMPQVIPKGEYKILFRAFTKTNQTFAIVYMNYVLDTIDPMKSMKNGRK